MAPRFGSWRRMSRCSRLTRSPTVFGSSASTMSASRRSPWRASSARSIAVSTSTGFRPRRQPLRDRLRALRRVFPDGVMPPIVAYEVGGMYFVVDGHHRVALAQQLEMEYVDAEITAIRISHALAPDVDVRQLIHTEQHRIFKERSRLLVGHPEAKIEFSRPTGYGQLLDLVQAHAYEMSLREEKLVPLEDATADWYEAEYLPAIAAVQEAEPRGLPSQDKGRHLPLGAGQASRVADDEPECDLGGCGPRRASRGCFSSRSSGRSRGAAAAASGRDQPIDTSRTVPPESDPRHSEDPGLSDIANRFTRPRRMLISRKCFSGTGY